MNKKDLLWISLCTPYSKIAHAGGQTLCHYYEQFINSELFNIKFISFFNSEEKNVINDSLMCNCENINLLCEDEGVLEKIINLENRANPLNRFGGYLSNSKARLLKKNLEFYKQKYKEPDYIILQWTEIVIFIKEIKAIFPNSKIISIEEDVSFLKRERRYKQSSNNLLRKFHRIRFLHSKKCEIEALNSSDLVVLNNEKDQHLVIDNNVNAEKTFLCCAYFKPMFSLKHTQKNNDIIFWGAMARKENAESAIWFIKNVMPKLDAYNFRFVVIGANPPQELISYNSEKIVVTGFVENPEVYFKESMCMVAPLINGAGIKVKVLEALSSGIPVITNKIGIEGIPAKDQYEYYYADTPDEYANTIIKISNMDSEEIKLFSKREQEFIEKNFCFENKIKLLINKILEL